MQAIIFDLDGTLVDSAPDIHAAANRMLAGLGAGPLDLETVTHFIGNGIEVLVRRCVEHLQLDLAETEIKSAVRDFSALYAADVATLTRPYPGARALLATLVDRRIPIGLCTNKPEAPARDILKRMSLASFFGVVVGGDTLPCRKPDPAPLLHTAAQLGAHPAQTLYVGDSGIDYQTAQRAGVPFAFFEGGYQRGEIKDFRPDHRISDLLEIAAL
ncbi:MAG: phosphoglycolate phosphatase [Alphaproteobacteria bacterium]|nr:phosphoglycolate phosphatase [Alphaproteobacteria bacterium]NNF24429.1 phosphoglycolate phosphatase [Paracoccaceae bacterium]